MANVARNMDKMLPSENEVEDYELLVPLLGKGQVLFLVEKGEAV